MTVTDTKLPAEGYMGLVMPNPFGADPEHRENPLANLDFGPAGRHAPDHDTTNIVFREVEPGVGRTIVRGDHPLLARLFEKYPQIVVDDGGPERIFTCAECDDGREFGSKIALRNHQRVHRKGEPVDEE
jgi:hypothetical protein